MRTFETKTKTETKACPSSHPPCPISKDEGHKEKNNETEKNFKQRVPRICRDILDKRAHKKETSFKEIRWQNPY